MEKFIPFAKMSKKQQQEITKKRRNSWGSLNPVTRKPDNPKAYNRIKARQWKENSKMPSLFSVESGKLKVDSGER